MKSEAEKFDREIIWPKLEAVYQDFIEHAAPIRGLLPHLRRIYGEDIALHFRLWRAEKISDLFSSYIEADHEDEKKPYGWWVGVLRLKKDLPAFEANLLAELSEYGDYEECKDFLDFLDGEVAGLDDAVLDRNYVLKISLGKLSGGWKMSEITGHIEYVGIADYVRE